VRVGVFSAEGRHGFLLDVGRMAGTTVSRLMRNATPKSLDARMTPKHSHVRPPVRAAFPVADAVCGSTRATADDSAVGTVEGSPALKPARVRARVCPPLSREFPRRSHLQLCRALRAVNGSRDLFFIFRLPLKQRLYPLGPRSARPRRTPTVGCCSVSTACAPPNRCSHPMVRTASRTASRTILLFAPLSAPPPVFSSSIYRNECHG
jgi:hypothetical protein